MNAQTLLETLATRGITARVDGNELKLRPASSLDAEMLAEVRAAKADLIALLAGVRLPDTCEEVATAHEYSRDEWEAVAQSLGEPPALLEMPGVEFCAKRGQWIRRIGGATWVVPTRATLIANNKRNHRN